MKSILRKRAAGLCLAALMALTSFAAWPVAPQAKEAAREPVTAEADQPAIQNGRAKDTKRDAQVQKVWRRLQENAKKERKPVDASVPSTYAAVSAPVCNPADYSYELANDEVGTFAIITKYKGRDSHIELPAYLGGYPAIAMSSDVFIDNDTVTDVTLSTEMLLPQMAFAGIDSIQNVWVQDGNPYYQSIDGVLFDITAQTLVCYPSGRTAETYVIPSSVKYIGGEGTTMDESYYCGFAGNMFLTHITIPSSVRIIGSMAFTGCWWLEDVTIENGATDIGAGAFAITPLTKLTIPNSVQRVHAGAFFGCKALTTFEVAENHPYLSTVNGYLYDRNKTKLILLAPGQQVTTARVADSVTDVNMDGLFYNLNLLRIVIPHDLANWQSDVMLGGTYNGEVTIIGNADEEAYYIADAYELPFEALVRANAVRPLPQVLEVRQGQHLDMYVQLSPGNSNDYFEYLYYATSNSNVVAIQEDGKIITAVGPGTANVYLKRHNDDKKYDTPCQITVIPKEEDLYVGILDTPSDTLNVRWGPGTDFGIIGVVNSAEAYTYLGKADNWYIIDFGGWTGFVSDKYAEKFAPVYPTEVKLNATALEMGVGETTRILHMFAPDTANIGPALTWQSADPKVARVDAEGNLTAQKPGTTVITASTEQGLQASCTITVVQNSMAKKVELTGSDVLNVRAQADATSQMLGAVYKGTKLSYLGTAENGWYCVNYDGVVGYVSNKYTTLHVPVEATGLTISQTEAQLVQGGTLQLTIGFVPENATIVPTVTWESDHPAIATVDQSGKVKGIAAGNCVVTARAEGLASVSCAITVKERPAQTQKVRIVGTDVLNVRSGPGVEYEMVGAVYRNQTFVCLGEENGWYAIEYNDGVGYISGKYAQLLQGGVQKAEIIDTDVLNVRSGPGVEYEMIGAAYRGQTFVYLGEENGWYKIEYNGGIGYISGKYSRLFEQAAGPEVIEVVNTDVLNVRSGPYVNYAMVGAAYRGQKFVCTGQEENGWYEILYKGQRAFISNKYTQKLSSDKQFVQIRDTQWLNVRSGPGVDYAMLGAGNEWDIYECLGQEKNGWYKITYKNGVGYISGKYASMVE